MFDCYRLCSTIWGGLRHSSKISLIFSFLSKTDFRLRSIDDGRVVVITGLVVSKYSFLTILFDSSSSLIQIGFHDQPFKCILVVSSKCLIECFDFDRLVIVSGAWV